ncbi:MAG: hypothetical protein ABJD97_00485 [Betaproteobacteria bacterium]
MTAQATRQSLKLQPRNLSERDIVKIGAFLRVGQDRFACDWSVVRDGPCHVLILGCSQQEPARAAESGADAILHVHETRGNQPPDALVQPLQYDTFVEALFATERKLMARDTAGASPAGGVAATARPAHGDAPPPRTFPVSPGTGLRLRRWPPAAILDAHRYNIRLASFMSGRHVSLDKLVQLSNVDQSQCEQFLGALSDAGILDMKVVREAAPASSAAAPRANALRRHVAADSGLLARIRHRLGLGRPG